MRKPVILASVAFAVFFGAGVQACSSSPAHQTAEGDGGSSGAADGSWVTHLV